MPTPTSRDHTCKICLKTYTKAEHLIRHERVHTGAKPYACKICTKAFARTDSLSRHAKVHLNGKVRKGRGSANTNATSISESATDQSLIEQHEGPMAAINEASFTASQTSADFAVVAQNQPLIDPMLMQQEVSPIDPMLNQDPNHYQPHHEQAYPEHELQPGLAQPHYQWPAPYNNYAPPHDQHNMFIYSSDSHAPQMMTAGQNYVANGYDGSQHLQAQTYMSPG